MRSFYLAYSTIIQTVSGQLNTASRDVIVQTPSAQLSQSYVYNLFALRAVKAARELKTKIISGEFEITEMVGLIVL